MNITVSRFLGWMKAGLTPASQPRTSELPERLDSDLLPGLVRERRYGWYAARASWEGVEVGVMVTGDTAAEAAAALDTAHRLWGDEAGWSRGRAPLLLETSRPGVLAVGDVRANNVKRVASAVGEGSVSVSLVHRLLAE